MTSQIIRNCRISESNELHDLWIRDEKIERIMPSTLDGESIVDIRLTDIEEDEEQRARLPGQTLTLDAQGALLLPGLIEPHIHLEKVLLLDRMSGDAASLQEAISMTAALKAGFTEEDMIERSVEVINKRSGYGVTQLRCHVEVDPMLQLRAMSSALEVKERMRSKVDMQIVVFPQEGIASAPGTVELMEEAVRMGADVIGGITYVDPDLEEHSKFVFELAERSNLPIDFHADFSLNPEDAGIIHIARKTVEYGYQGNVSAGHVTSLAAMSREKASLYAGQIAEAGLHLMTLPATDLYLNGRGDDYNVRRGIAPIGLLRDHGVNVIYGSNNIQNAFTPFGSGNPLDVAWLLGHAAFMGSRKDTETLVEMATYGAAKALGLRDYGLWAGAQADLVMFPVQSKRQLIIERPRPIGVWKRGCLLANENSLEWRMK